MRFGRQRKSRAAEALSESGTVAASTAETGGTVEELAARSEESESTQQLLSALGRFQQELATVDAGEANARWVDECMNHLILAMEVALQDGWLEMVEALADAGRVLQSYDNAKRSKDAIPFLKDAYEMLCGMVGGSIVDGNRAESGEPWSSRYGEAVRQLESEGIELASDNDEDDSDAHSASNDDLPFDMPSLDSTAPRAGGDDELPTLDELPSLEGMLEMGANGPLSMSAHAKISQPVPNKVEPQAVQAPAAKEPSLEAVTDTIDSSDSVDEDKPETKESKPTSLGAEPSQLVVDVMDRICDELAQLESEPDEDRNDALATIEGGIQALQREALEHHQKSSASLADSILDVCRRAIKTPNVVDERFTDLAFAFCGVYVEAMEGNSENTRQWSSECVTLMSSWDMDDAQPVAEEPEAEDKTEDVVEADNPFELLADTAEKIEASELESAPEPPALEAVIEEKEASIEDSAAASPPLETVKNPSIPVAERSESTARNRSEELLAQAQEAALSGNTQLAQQFALQAAAAIGEQGVEDAEGSLSAAEAQLRTCLDEIEQTREAVRTCDQGLAKSEELVTEGERHLQKVEATTGKTRKNLEVLHGQVDELTRQIEELMSQQNKQAKQVEMTQATLEANESEQEAASEELSQRQKGVANSRAELEMSRQAVKTKQRSATEIEADIVRVREALHEKQASLKSILTTLPAAEAASQDDDAAQENLF